METFASTASAAVSHASSQDEQVHCQQWRWRWWCCSGVIILVTIIVTASLAIAVAAVIVAAIEFYGSFDSMKSLRILWPRCYTQSSLDVLLQYRTHVIVVYAFVHFIRLVLVVAMTTLIPINVYALQC